MKTEPKAHASLAGLLLGTSISRSNLAEQWGFYWILPYNFAKTPQHPIPWNLAILELNSIQQVGNRVRVFSERRMPTDHQEINFKVKIIKEPYLFGIYIPGCSTDTEARRETTHKWPGGFAVLQVLLHDWPPNPNGQVTGIRSQDTEQDRAYMAQSRSSVNINWMNGTHWSAGDGEAALQLRLFLNPGFTI